MPRHVTARAGGRSRITARRRGKAVDEVIDGVAQRDIDLLDGGIERKATIRIQEITGIGDLFIGGKAPLMA